MLDFGPTASTGSPNNSPYHTAQPTASINDSSWNTLGTVDVNTGLVYADNTSATGVTINSGSSAGATIALGSQPASSSALGGVANSGVYSGNSVGKDGIFGAAGERIGLQIGGLAAGSYSIYITARNTSTADNVAAYTETVYAAASSVSGDFNYTGFTSSALTFSNPTAGSSFTSSWVQGQNYVLLNVNLAAGQYLNIAVAGSGSDTRGFLNSVQIVGTSAIPEPATYAVLAGASVLAGAAYRRRRRASKAN